MVGSVMIRQNQKEESLVTVSQNSPTIKNRRRNKRHTVRFDTELMNQVDFLANYFELKKLEILRQLVKRRLQEDPKVWDTYVTEYDKKFSNHNTKKEEVK